MFWVDEHKNIISNVDRRRNECEYNNNSNIELPEIKDKTILSKLKIKNNILFKNANDQ